jgi:methanogenic corrinoid protein MtbC1
LDHIVYSIGTVSKLSGVPVETIRIWERRYEMPSPTRTPGGHRKYKDDDVVLLRALKALTDEGARIGALAGESREAILQAARLLASPSANTPPDERMGEIDFSDLAAQVVEAARDKRTSTTAALLNRPLLHRHPREVILGLYLPVLRQVGDLWHAGDFDVASEHFIEKQITARLHSVLLNREERSDGPRAVLACAPTERHEAGLLASAVLLNLAGFDVTHLGADLPVDELARVVDEAKPRLVVLSSTVPLDDETLAEVAAGLEGASFGSTTIVVGGNGGAAIAHAATRPVTVVSSLEELETLAREIARAA